MSGTDTAYGARTAGRSSLRPQVRYAICLRACYALPGSDITYAASRNAPDRHAMIVLKILINLRYLSLSFHKCLGIKLTFSTCSFP